MEEKLREVVALLRSNTPLNELTEQEGYEILTWAEDNLARGQTGEPGPRTELSSRCNRSWSVAELHRSFSLNR